MFYEQLKKACKENNTSITAVLKKLGIGTANGTYWKNGSSPSADIVVKLSEFLGVSCDYLLTDEEHHNSTNISHSAIGALGNHSHGTVTMNASSIETEMKMKSDNQAEQAMSETSKELLAVFESLPMRERVKLLNMVYDFEEKYRNSNPTIE